MTPIAASAAASAPYSLTWDPWSASAGPHTLVVKAYDAASNVGSSSAVNVTYAPPVDTQVPTVAISSPADGATVNDSSTIAVTASDDVHVAQVELAVDGTVAAHASAAPYVFPVSGLSLAAGTHVLAATAIDAAGNRAASTPITVTMDTTPTPQDVVLYAADATLVGSKWGVVADATAAGGARLHNPNAGVAKITQPLAAPASYAELTFTAVAGQPYHLWIRARADNDSYTNDSAYVQFSDSIDGAGASLYRIGSAAAVDYVLEDCDGCGEQGWGWQDNAYGAGALGPDIVFATTGVHTLRVQQREDGLSIDQIVLSPITFSRKSPGSTKNDTTILPRQ